MYADHDINCDLCIFDIYWPGKQGSTVASSSHAINDYLWAGGVGWLESSHVIHRNGRLLL
jgi:hypothetical protein